MSKKIHVECKVSHLKDYWIRHSRRVYCISTWRVVIVVCMSHSQFLINFFFASQTSVKKPPLAFYVTNDSCINICLGEKSKWFPYFINGKMPTKATSLKNERTYGFFLQEIISFFFFDVVPKIIIETKMRKAEWKNWYNTQIEMS